MEWVCACELKRSPRKTTASHPPTHTSEICFCLIGERTAGAGNRRSMNLRCATYGGQGIVSSGQQQERLAAPPDLGRRGRMMPGSPRHAPRPTLPPPPHILRSRFRDNDGRWYQPSFRHPPLDLAFPSSSPSPGPVLSERPRGGLGAFHGRPAAPPSLPVFWQGRSRRHARLRERRRIQAEQPTECGVGRVGHVGIERGSAWRDQGLIPMVGGHVVRLRLQLVTGWLRAGRWCAGTRQRWVGLVAMWWCWAVRDAGHGCWTWAVTGRGGGGGGGGPTYAIIASAPR